MSSHLDDPRLTAMGLFAEVYTGLTGRLGTELERHRLSLVEFEVLMRLARSPGQRLRMTDLAAQTSLSTSGVTRVVDRMDRGGMVRREACPSDRRSYYAVITAQGLTTLDATLPGQLDLLQQWFVGQLEPGQLDTMLQSLRVIRDAVHPCATAGSDGFTDETVVPPS